MYALLLLPGLSSGFEVSENLTINGFYSIEANISGGENSNFPGGKAHIQLEENELSLTNSLLGLQADYRITDELRLSLQGLISNDPEEGPVESLEWAYLSYDFGNDLTMRGGRFHPSFLQGTELRYVGYSRLWARPLVPSNGTAGFDEYQGAEFIKRNPLGDYNLTVQGAYGVADHVLPTIENDDIKLLSLTMEKDESWLKLGYFQSKYDIYAKDMSTLLASNTDVWLGSIESELLLDKHQINFGLVDGDSESGPNEQLAYFSYGYHFGKATPYLLYQHRSMVFDASKTPLPAGPPPGPPPPDAPPPPPPPRDGEDKNDNFALGLRYDLGDTYAIKAQVERQFYKSDSDPLIGEVESNATVYTLILEGVF